MMLEARWVWEMRAFESRRPNSLSSTDMLQKRLSSWSSAERRMSRKSLDPSIRNLNWDIKKYLVVLSVKLTRWRMLAWSRQSRSVSRMKPKKGSTICRRSFGKSFSILTPGSWR